ncbi:MAG: hypothetical protein ABI333_17345 [bacterium]
MTATQQKAFTVETTDRLQALKGDRYLRSNETELQLFGPYINDLGGGYLGVGADQNYTLAAMAQSSHVWLMDYDPWVVRLHNIYRALILETDTPGGFVKLWPQRNQVQALIAKYYGAYPAKLKELLWIYKRYRTFLKPYLRWSLKRKRKGVGVTWLSNETLYKRVRTMWQEGRFQPLAGDLHGANVFQGICAAAQRLGIKIRIVYLSNAEMYLPYSKSFLANMKAVPWDAKTQLVRTVRGDKYPMKSDRWHYNVQPFGSDYLRRLGLGRYRRIHHMMQDFWNTPYKVRRALMRPKGFSRFTEEVLDYDQHRKQILDYLRRKRRRRR